MGLPMVRLHTGFKCVRLWKCTCCGPIQFPVSGYSFAFIFSFSPFRESTSISMAVLWRKIAYNAVISGHGESGVRVDMEILNVEEVRGRLVAVYGRGSKLRPEDQGRHGFQESKVGVRIHGQGEFPDR
jgi:hypothetical protein